MTHLPRRTVLLVLVSASTAAGLPALAQDCSPKTVARLRRDCETTLRDIEATRAMGDAVRQQALRKYAEAVEPTAKCFKGSFNLLKAAAVECNPSSPGVNPVACIETVVGIPDLIEECRTAYRLVSQAMDLMRQARDFYGAAEVAFYDQGADVFADALTACGYPACAEIAAALSDAALKARERAVRDIENMRRLLEKLQEVDGALEECQADNEACQEIPAYEVPELEGGKITPPDIILH